MWLSFIESNDILGYTWILWRRFECMCVFFSTAFQQAIEMS